MKTLEINVEGRVQGVSYRYFTAKKANKYNITGQVKNLFNGNVNVIATGKDTDLELFLEELKHGPSLAHVTALKINEIPFEEYDKFRIVY